MSLRTNIGLFDWDGRGMAGEGMFGEGEEDGKGAWWCRWLTHLFRVEMNRGVRPSG